MRRLAQILCTASLTLFACGDGAPADGAESLELQLDGTFSPAHYDRIAARSIPIEPAARAALDAFASTTLIAQEVDLFEDDWIERSGAMIFLGHEGGRLVGLTTRHSVDLGYPDPKLVADGFGAAELGVQTLSIGGAAPVELVRPGIERPDAATVRMFDDHDVALVYLPDDGRPTLGLEAPTTAVTQHVEQASHLFGFEMTLVSDAALAALRGGVTVRSTGGRLLIMGAALALDPVLGALIGAPDVIDPAIVDALQNALAKLGARQLEELTGPLMDRFEMFAPLPSAATPEALDGPRAVQLHRMDALELDADGAVSLHDGKTLPWHGVASVDPERVVALASLIGDAELVVVELAAGDAIVLVPEARLVLNLELLGHGLAQPAETPSLLDDSLTTR